MIEISDDISTLTTIPKTAIDDLFDLESIAISHCLYEALCNGESTAEVDIGFGTLYIYVNSDDIKMKLEPNKKMTELLLMCSKRDIDPLTLRIDNSLKERLNKVYKELM